MSRLDELIAELCPDGVKYIPLKTKELFSFRYGKGNTIPDDTNGIYDVYGANGIVSHIDDYNCEDVSIIGHIGAVGLVHRCKTKCFVTYNGTIAEVTNKERVDSQYFYYVLSKLNLPSYKKGNQPFLSVSDFHNISIPVPPLPVQHEIVRILDGFTELTAELTAELIARKKQYEYYREAMIVDADAEEFSVQELIDAGMIEEPLDGNHGDVHPKKADYVSSGVPFIMANDLKKGTIDYTKCAYITEKQASTLRKGFAKPGDVLLTHKGTIGRTAIVPELYGTTILTPQVTYYRVLKGINNRYLKHYFDSKIFQNQIKAIAALGGTRAYIGITAQHALKIRLPNLETQNNIANILDCFDSLCNDISSGLPAEIAARQKQYEYYRDKLLSFKELK